MSETAQHQVCYPFVGIVVTDPALPFVQRSQPSGSRGAAGGNSSGRHNAPVPPPPQHDGHKEKNNGYVVRPPGAEPLEGHPRYTKIREINSGAFAGQ